MDAFIRALPAVLRAAGDSEEVIYAAVVVAWRDVAGEALRELAIPTKLVQNTLTVAVPDAIWKTQLEAMRGQFLFRLNSILGRPLVRLLEFRIQPEIVAAAGSVRCSKNSSVNRDDSPIPSELLSAAASIRDESLRRAFLAAATSSLNRQANDRKQAR
ncbi:MAG TPA: DUF721 domain-containing protein [Pyrinomonadaceae bacterium]|nr:DUF721 domain-containing protein [Pyrinomonadaceae bacterium]